MALRNNMGQYFIPHKLKTGDITYLSDKDSEFVISKKLLQVEDLVKVSTLEGIFWGVVTNMTKVSVEIEIKEKISDIKAKSDDFSLTVIQSLSNDAKFNLFLEKSVEIGVDKIVPVESKYSLVSKKKAMKRYGVWQKIINEAKEQSRNPNDVEISKPINLKDLDVSTEGYRMCFATEVEGALSLNDSLKGKKTMGKYIIAVGPERGWSVSDLEVFKDLGFEFVKLGGNILRTETAPLVIASILNFKAGIY